MRKMMRKKPVHIREGSILPDRNKLLCCFLLVNWACESCGNEGSEGTNKISDIQVRDLGGKGGR